MIRYWLASVLCMGGGFSLDMTAECMGSDTEQSLLRGCANL